jgi:cation diffusion facilitator family transporter
VRASHGLRAVVASFAILFITAAAQTAIFALTGSVALLTDLIHNAGDALTAVPLGLAFVLRSRRIERVAEVLIIAAIVVSAMVAGVEAVRRVIRPHAPDHLLVLAAGGIIGTVGNWWAGRVRTNAGRELENAALMADADHALIDAFVSLAVVASSILVYLGLPMADPIIALASVAVIVVITVRAWRTIRHADRDRS